MKPTSFFNIKPSNFDEGEKEKTTVNNFNPFLKCENEGSSLVLIADSSVKNDDSAKLEQSGKSSLFSNVKAKTLFTESVDFVFGQNLHERVVATPPTSTSEDTDKNLEISFPNRAKTPERDKIFEVSCITKNLKPT